MDKVKEKIVELVYNYSAKGKFVDAKFVETVASLIIEAKKIDDYVVDLKYSLGDRIPLLSCYDYATKTVCIDIARELSESFNRVVSEGFMMTEFEKYLKTNLAIVNAIMHEITHAEQYKKCLLGKNDLEKEILELSLERNLFLIRNQDKINEISENKKDYMFFLRECLNDDIYYVSSPSERMANLKALELEKMIGHELVLPESKKIGEYVDLRYLKGQRLGYQDFSPTAFIMSVHNVGKKGFELTDEDLDMIKCCVQCNKMSTENNCTLDEKLYYGLPINMVETEILDRKERKLSRRLFS